MYRISIVVLDGPHVNLECFDAYMAQPSAEVVYSVAEPGGAARAYYIWRQTGELKKPASCTEFHTPDLLTAGGKNGWATLAEAGAVLENHIGKLENVDWMVLEAQLKAAVVGVPEAIAGGAKDLVADAADVAEKTVNVTPWWVKAGVAVASLAVLGYAIRSVR